MYIINKWFFYLLLMRNVVIFNDNGEYFECDYIGNCNPEDMNFVNRYFKLGGNIICIPLLETFKVYANTFELETLKELLSKVEDPYNIHLVYNSFVNEENDAWRNNKFLSTIFGVDIYAENISLFVSNDDIIGFKEVDEKEYALYVSKILEIIECVKKGAKEECFSSLSLYVDNNTTIIINDKEELKEWKRKYDNGEYDLFTNIEDLGDGNLLLKKKGMIMIVDNDNKSEMYFECCKRDAIINGIGYVEKIS